MNVVEQKASRSSVDSSDLSLIEDLGEAAGNTTSNGPMEQRSREFAKEVLKLKKLDTYIRTAIGLWFAVLTGRSLLPGQGQTSVCRLWSK